MKKRGKDTTALGCLGLALFCSGVVEAGTRPSAEKEIPWKAAETLQALAVEPSEKGVRVIIRADGAMEHRVYIQENPPRLVLDILNVRNPLKDREPPDAAPYLARILSQELPMSAYVQGEYGKTFGRIVLDLKEPVEYRVRAEEAELKVELIGKSEAERLNDGSDSGPTAPLAVDDSVGPVAADDSVGPIAADDSVGPIAEQSEFSEVSIEPADIDPGFFFGPAPASSDEYRLGPEDVVEIRVFELDQLNRTARISGDGRMELPLIGSVPVRGLTPEEVAGQVADRLRNRFVQNPQVSVFVKEFNSRKVSLLGAIGSPATYPLVGRRNLLQLLADAGGLSGGAGTVLYVFRPTDDGRSARLTVPLNELLIKGDPRWNIWLRAGDIISVPPEKAVSVSVLGAVRSPGVYKLPVGDGASVLNAIARAGGLHDRASKSGIQVKRRDASGDETVLKVDLGDILSGEKPDVILREGDVVVVKESFF
jgi:polysaccharide export outer membrane protein